MKIYDYSFLENGLLPAGLINIASAISELRERENGRKDNFSEIFTKLESIAKVQSVKGSNEIEGIITSDQRVNEIVNQNSAPLNHNEQEIAGYRDALKLVHDNYINLDIRERDIQNLHEIMLSYSPVNGVEASETKNAMEQLILAFMDARSNYSINQLLLIPCFILDFLCIHPFADGNGRMSRLLSLLLLYKNGFDAGKYISFEEQINLSKAAYYQSLKDSSDGWHENKNSYFPFMENFVTTLLFCYKELDKRFAVVGSTKVTKRKRIEATVLGSLLPISKKEICYILPDVSPTTVEAVLSEMIKNELVEKIGSARNTKYIRT